MAELSTIGTKTREITALAALLAGLALALNDHAAAQTAPGSISQGTCNQMRALYDANTLWFGQVVGEDFNYGERGYGKTVNKVRCFTGPSACSAWLKDISRQRSRINYWGCEKGQFPRKSLPIPY